MSKSGPHDELRPLDSGGRLQLGDLLGEFAAGRRGSEPLFRFSMARWRREIKKAGGALGAADLDLSLHALRHSGPSNDIATRCRTLAQVQKRGRWKCASTLQRYEKSGRLQVQLKKLPRATIEHLRMVEARLDQLVKPGARPLRPPFAAA